MDCPSTTSTLVTAAGALLGIGVGIAALLALVYVVVRLATTFARSEVKLVPKEQRAGGGGQGLTIAVTWFLVGLILLAIVLPTTYLLTQS